MALQIFGVNYYPAHHPWWRMWCEWDPGEISAELDIAANLDANTVRTFLPFSLIGQLASTPDHRRPLGLSVRDILDRVDQFLGMTAGRQMHAIVSMFDEAELLPDLVRNLPASLSYVEQVLNYVTRDGIRLGDDRRVLMWDLVNELDDEGKVTRDNPPRPLFIHLNFPQAGGVQYVPSPAGMAWLDAVYRHVYALTGSDRQITFGALNPLTSVYMIKRYPAVRHTPQYHEYLPYNPEQPMQYLQDVSERMTILPLRTGRSPLIGEYGMPSNLTKDNVTWTPELQNEAARLFLQAVDANSDKLLGVLHWTLTDWDFQDAVENAEKYSGLFTVGGKPKPAAASVQTAYTGYLGVVPT
ncbi:MAG: hypothetical protein ACR2M0_09830 [Chloroflexia bacterium]